MEKSDDETVAITDAVTNRGIIKIKTKLIALANEIKEIRNKGFSALTVPSDRMVFRGMYQSLERVHDRYLCTWDQAVDYALDSPMGAKLFPLPADTTLNDDVRKQIYEIQGYYLQLAPLLQPLSNSTFNEFNSSGNQNVAHSQSRAILPKIPIKPFNGDIVQWPTFKQLFSSLIKDDPMLTDTEKFHYLISYLTGPANDTVKHVAITGENFQQAWAALIRVYDDKRKLACSYINKLLGFRPVSGKPTSESLQAYLSEVAESIASLKGLKIQNLGEYILCELALRGLDQQTREEFEMSCTDTTFPTFTTLEQFVQRRCKVLRLTGDPVCQIAKSNQRSIQTHKPIRTPNSYGQRRHSNQALMAHSSQPSSRNPGTTTRQPQHSNISSDSTCYICKQGHTISSCPQFISSSPAERLNLLKHFNGCRNCLHPRHKSKDCRSPFTCRECGSRHHSDLHLPTNASGSNHASGNQASPGRSSTHSNQPSAQSACTLAATTNNQGGVLLGTVIAHMKGFNGRLHRLRGVLDPGSQHSFVTEKCAKQLGQIMQPTSHRICGVNNTPLNNIVGQTEVSFDVPFSPATLVTTAVVVPSITPPLPITHLDADIWQDYKSYRLSDPNFDVPAPVSFLIGADLYPEVILGAPIILHESGPRLIETVFGYTVIGRLIADTPVTHHVSLLTHSDILPLIERFWKIEEPATTAIHLSPEEKKCEEHFLKTHRRDETGRYIVRYPFKEPTPTFQLNSNKVIGQYHSLESRVQKNQDLKAKYEEFMGEYLALGHMSLATSPPAYLIPHHPIYRKETGKLRVVFDGSFRTPSGSLNDKLMTGPKLQADIGDIVLHFRRFKYVLTCDVVKMFRQIVIAPEDRKYQQIAWRSEPAQPIKFFELNTVTYGLRSSPYLAQRVLQQLVQDEGGQYPVAAEAILRHTYVDDVAYGADSIKELYQLKEQLIQLLSKAGFQLDKWSSNHPPILAQRTLEQEPVQLITEEPAVTRILGMQWNPLHDTFSYNVTQPDGECTKRNILSVIARLFDPLGYLSPAIFQAKHILQETWKSNIDWDEQVPQHLSTAWVEFISQLPYLSNINIPRHLPKSESTFQLLGFSDASQKGYCGAVYLRAQHGSDFSITLLKSKTRLAPLKSLTIPRLELCGALLLSQVIKSLGHLKQTLNITETFCFTDSTIVLAWLKSPTYLLQTFVANRVQQVLDITALEWWHHIKGSENPADLGSRGIPPAELLHAALWWSGPSWSHNSIDTWPISKDTEDVEVPELKRTVLSLISVQQNTAFLLYTERHSSFVRLIRVIATIKRFAFNCHIPKQRKFCRKKGPLSSTEIRDATNHCVRLMQQSYYPAAFSSSTFNELPTELRRLAVFMDGDGILRVGGRLLNAPLPYAEKHPVLLPARSHFTSLIVDFYHCRNHHIGPTALLASIRQCYWIPSARNLIRLIRRRCVVCIRFSRMTLSPQMANLPAARFNSVRPFLHTGVDFAGPFLCRTSTLRRSSIEKSYLCVFICLSSRAVHLEIAVGLSVENFLDVFERFIARRGLPSTMYSDCGTNFIGTSSYLRDLFQFFRQETTQTALINHTAHLSISWKFNPPLSPHFGGGWEAAVKSAKTLLLKSFGNQSYTSWELSTMCTKVEGILNSRPLLPVLENPEDSNALTPGHFLIGQPLTALPEPDYSDIPPNRLKRWELIRERVQYFWQLWRDEYVRGLQERDKWTKKPQNLKVGDLVLVNDSNSSPAQWPMARILQVHPGKDQIIRVVTLQTARGVYKRPVIRLVPLLHCYEDPGP